MDSPVKDTFIVNRGRHTVTNRLHLEFGLMRALGYFCFLKSTCFSRAGRWPGRALAGNSYRYIEDSEQETVISRLHLCLCVWYFLWVIIAC